MADRTNGLNNIDIGSGRRGFRNRNLGLGQAGTIVDAEWANGVQEEIVRLIELLGIAPSPSNREQVTQAIRRIASGNTRTLSATTALTADDAGLVYVSAAAGNVVLTLPAASAAGGLPLRFTIVRTDLTTNTVTIQRAGSDTIEGGTSAPILPRDRLTLASNGSNGWNAQAAAGFLFSPGSAGFYRFPGNAILQWGVATLPASGTPSATVAVTFPTAFAISAYQAVATPRGALNSSTGKVPSLTTSAPSTTGFSLYGEAPDGVTVFNQSVACAWYAFGN